MKRTCRFLPAVALLLGSLTLVHAQSLIDVNMGFGSAQNKATASGIEGDYSTAANGANWGTSCAIGSTASCVATKKLGGFMLGFGANLMLWEHFGVGVEVITQPNKPQWASVPMITQSGVIAQSAYNIQSRTTFYDFNGIYQPVKTSRAALQLVGGIGGAKFSSFMSQSSSSVLGNSNSTQALLSSNHFNVHAGVGVQIYLTDHVYLRPQFDVHYVPNFTQYGRNLVTQEMVWLGYTIGDRK